MRIQTREPVEKPYLNLGACSVISYQARVLISSMDTTMHKMSVCRVIPQCD